MKRKLALVFSTLLISGIAHAESLYYVGSEAQESMPLKWVVGMDLSYDDNMNPGYTVGGQTVKDDSGAISPYVGLSFVNMTPQTTWDVYARLGCTYYFQKPDAPGSKDFYTLGRAGVNLTHRFNERLRLSSRNFLSYELEPDYTQGFATNRQSGAYLFWQTDNALGYRWTERVASYTGFTLTGLDYADANTNDLNRFTWELYNQMRYQLNPQQSVLTFDYRYSDTTAGGVASDSTSQYVLLGIEHRFSPNTIMIARAGVQFYDSDKGSNSTSPYGELTLRTQINEQTTLRAFVRYGLEAYDSVQSYHTGVYDFSQRAVLRIGLSGDYVLSPMFTISAGADYINAVNDDGRLVGGTGSTTASGLSQDLINLYVGLTAKFTDSLYGTLTYNYTDSTSDFQGQDYNRNRVSIGLRYEF